MVVASPTVSTASRAWPPPPATTDARDVSAAWLNDCAKPGDGDRFARMYRSRTFRTPHETRDVR